MLPEKTVRPVAVYHGDLPTKFGVPRQSGLVPLRGRISFISPYRDPACVRGIEGFSHLWLIWGFSLSDETDALTVRPPRLGGNERIGVFATRSPFRPNGLGLSSVRLLSVGQSAGGELELNVEGADLADGTPIYDIKPYLPYTDAHPEASSGFTDRTVSRLVGVRIPEEWAETFSEEERIALTRLLAEDPRPGYQEDSARVYGVPFAGRDVRFRVTDGVLTVCEVLPLS